MIASLVDFPLPKFTARLFISSNVPTAQGISQPLFAPYCTNSLGHSLHQPGGKIILTPYSCHHSSFAVYKASISFAIFIPKEDPKPTQKEVTL